MADFILFNHILFIYLFIYLLFIYLSIYLFIYLFIFFLVGGGSGRFHRLISPVATYVIYQFSLTVQKKNKRVVEDIPLLKFC